MRIALAQINPTVGDVAGNARKIADCIDQARSRRADLVICPELAIIGYPPKDLLLKPVVIEQCRAAVERLAAHCVGIAAIIGTPIRAANPHLGRELYNAAAFCAAGRIEHFHIKSLLPSYDVFDEQRYFEPAPLPGQTPPPPDHDPGAPPAERNDYASLNGYRLGVSICEDLWNDPDLFPRRLYAADPMSRLAAGGAELLINCSASPFTRDKHPFRMKILTHAARRYGLPVVYCNQVGGNDELVFDGASVVVDSGGAVLAQARAFEEDLLIVEVPMRGRTATAGRIEPIPEGIASVYHALVLGLRDYCRKCGFESIVLGLSGGIDSALCAALAVAALGPENVRGVAMPSRHSSQGSVDDARELALRLGIAFDCLPIEPAHRAIETMLEPIFKDLAPDVTEENIQARLRGNLLMAMSNKLRSLLVTTGNKSEVAVGYCTLYGDMAGGLAVLSDVPKTAVWEMARWINTSPASPLLERFGRPVIPENSITKPPSAELRPDQKDEDSLPPYPVLDQIIERYVERDQSATRIIEETGIDADIVRRIIRLIDLSEYKRKQAAPGLKVTGRAFGFGRRMPIAQRHDASDASLAGFPHPNVNEPIPHE
ncbi:MAG: NAD+ synthase [Phycisphaeraceae bacterium]|nr:NAD+ synthase [Phycisphaeraceae bacterium]